MSNSQESFSYLPAIILVNPQMGENIGAAARAMLNFGITSLRIVNPRDGWPNARATDMASGAFEKIPPPKIFKTLEEAVADLHIVYATTARPREIIKPVFTPQEAAKNMYQNMQSHAKAGIVFGGERAGLSNDHIALCQNIISIPVNPDFSSLNLGQAVLLVCYELFSQGDQTAPLSLELGKSDLAPQAELENFLQRLEDGLQEGGFFRSADMAPAMKRNIRAYFTRSQPTRQEINTLHGIIKTLKSMNR